MTAPEPETPRRGFKRKTKLILLAIFLAPVATLRALHLGGAQLGLLGG